MPNKGDSLETAITGVRLDFSVTSKVFNYIVLQRITETKENILTSRARQIQEKRDHAQTK